MKKILFAVLALALTGSALAATAEPVLKVGEKAPGFTLPYATRDSIARVPLSLSSLEGQRNVVVAFYPADWSGGCTKEVCTLRDNFADLGALDAEIVAISGDYVFSHHEWAKYHNLPFRLASDHDHAVAKKYGVYNPATGHDNRTIFVVGKDGKIAYDDYHYSVADSVSFDKLKTALAKLK